MDKNADSAIQRLYRIHVFSSIVFLSLNCSNTDSFHGVQLVLFLMDEFFLTLIAAGLIFFFFFR